MDDGMEIREKNNAESLYIAKNSEKLNNLQNKYPNEPALCTKSKK